MFYPICAYANALDDSFLLGIAYGLPAFLSGLGAAKRSMNEVQVNITETALSKRRFYRLSDSGIPVILFEFSREKYLGAVYPGRLAKIENSLSNLTFIFIPFRGVLSVINITLTI